MVSKIMKEITLIFPYEEYDHYLPVIKKINDLVSVDGSMSVFANNVPFNLEAGIFITTTSNFEDIINLAKKNNMEFDYSRGLNEILKGMAQRQYNMIGLIPELSETEIESMLRPIFLFSSKSDFEKEGFEFSKFSKKKIFVSYCHKNKVVVRDIIDNLRSYGLDFWIDEEQIDVGDRLMERIDKGMREADIPMVFLSNATKESMYAKHELQTFFSQIIYQTGDRKNWYIVKLDDVNPNDILLGLGDFKYFDVEANDINELADSLKRKLK